MSEVKQTPIGLQAFFSRPGKFYENVDSGTVEMRSTATEMVYVRACRDCELRATTKLAKCIVESCSNVKVAFEEPIMSGTLELIDCQNVSIFINPRDSLPTISAERCQTLQFHLVRPGALGSVYTVQCENVVVHFKPPHCQEHRLPLPEGGAGGDQFVSYLSEEKMVTEKVVREGAGYATTETKLAEAEKRQKELMRRCEEHVVKTLNIRGLPPGPAPPTAPSDQPGVGGQSNQEGEESRVTSNPERKGEQD